MRLELLSLLSSGAHPGGGVMVFFSSRRRHTRFDCDWSSDVCSSDLLTVDDLEMIAGRRDQLIGRLQIRYGIANEEASRQVDEFVSSLKPKVKMMKRVAHH